MGSEGLNVGIMIPLGVNAPGVVKLVFATGGPTMDGRTLLVTMTVVVPPTTDG